MTRRLNGWQRLWVVLAVIYLLPVVGFTIALFPKQRDLVSSRVYDSIRAVGEYREKNDSGFRFEGAFSFRAKYYSDISDDEIIKGLHEKWGSKVDFSKIEVEYKQKLDALPAERAKAVGIALLAWLVPVLAVYVLGLAVTWIIRGFRRESP